MCGEQSTYMEPRPRLPPIRRLVCAFDMRDAIENSVETYKRAMLRHEHINPLGTFDDPELDQRWKAIHECKKEIAYPDGVQLPRIS